MNFSKFLTGGLLVLGLMGLAVECKDPGDPNGGGKPKRIAISIGDGRALSKAEYGMWRADDIASEKCRWRIVDSKGRKIASGGKDDAIIVGSAVRGATLRTNCGVFRK